MGAVLGLSPFAGPLEVLAEKLGKGEPFPMSGAMMVGAMLEPAVGERIQEEKGHRIFHATDLVGSLEGIEDSAIHLGDGTFRSKQYPRLIVTPDYVGVETDEPEAVYIAEEIKVVGRWSGSNLFSPPSASKPKYPASYAVQVVAQIGTLGLDGGRLWALVQNGKIPDKEVEWLYNESLTNPEHFRWWAKGYVSRQSLRSYDIPYTTEKFEELGEIVTKFWVDHVETGRPDPAWRPVVRRDAVPAPEVDTWGELEGTPEEF